MNQDPAFWSMQEGFSPVTKSQGTGKRIVSLPEDLVIEIQQRLPAKSLLRFMCVCKSWNARFRDYKFVSMHCLRHRDNDAFSELVLVCDMGKIFRQRLLWTEMRNSDGNGYAVTAAENDFLPKLEDPYVYTGLASPCNGLMCWRVVHKWFNNTRLFLWNPTTKELKILPKIPKRPGTGRRLFNTRFQSIGLGYDDRKDDYKVVQFVQYENRKLDRELWDGVVKIYSLRNNSWKEISYETGEHVPLDRTNLYINGVCHWKRISDIVSLDMRDEVLTRTDLPVGLIPESPAWLKFVWGLIVYRGHPAVTFSKAGLFEEKIFDVWVLKEVGVQESWTKQLRIGPIHGIFRPLRFWKNNFMFMENTSYELMLYNLETETLEKLNICSSGGCLGLVDYAPSLVPIDIGRREHEDGPFSQPLLPFYEITRGLK